MAETFKYKKVKVRKARQCFSCFRKFDIGAEMIYWAGKYEGDFCANYHCLTCDKIMDLDKESYEFPEGYVDEWLNKGQTPEQLLETLLNK